jgi:tRNA(adenine34) deaminase
LSGSKKNNDAMRHYMQAALAQAKIAQSKGEVPVGAVVELDGKVIGKGYNQNRMRKDPSAHAEIIALREAAKRIGNYRLNGANLYVSLEPCVMCAGAILHARIKRVIYAAADERWGAAGSVANVLQSPLLNHQCSVTSGLMQREAAALIRQFFRDKRSGANN